jgi:hypothetical protein
MNEYCENVPSKVPAQPPPEPRNVNLQPLQNLGEKYGLGKHMQIGRSAVDADEGQISVKAEYNAYIIGNLSEPDMNILKIWEVRRPATYIFDLLLTSFPRCTVVNFQLFSPWPWTTCPYRPPLYLPSVFFLRALKPTPRDKIESIQF